MGCTGKLERRVVKMMDQFLWVLFPYIIFAIFIGGHIFRYNYDQFGWTSKSSELLEKKMLRIGSLLFHFGIMFVIGGHVMGILIPEAVYRSIGISEHMYHVMAISFGLPKRCRFYHRFNYINVPPRNSKTHHCNEYKGRLYCAYFITYRNAGRTFLNVFKHRLQRV